MRMGKSNTRLALLLISMFWAVGAHALPALQLGAGADASNWTYDNSDQTWLYTGSDSPFNILATANATKANGGAGKYAWDATGAANQYAYLVVSALPHGSAGTDYFDVAVADNSGGLAMIDSGWGNPPLNDPNSLSGHGIFDAYFEVFEFQFNGAIGEISNTQPGDSGTGRGYSEYLDVTVNSLLAGVEGIHFDLFTVAADTSGNRGYSGLLSPNSGQWDPTDPDSKKMVYAFAPYSHDGGTGCCGTDLSEPGTLGMMLIGMIGVGASGIRRRRLRK